MKLVDRKTNSSKEFGEFGVLSDLLKWHCEHQVHQRERDRNDIVQQWQGNRNPFIDKPEFVQAIWGKEFPEAFVKCNKTNKTNPEPQVWINELHYVSEHGISIDIICMPSPVSHIGTHNVDQIGQSRSG